MPVRRWSRGLGAAATFVVLGLTGTVQAETLVVAGRPLELAPPFGFCRLSPEVPQEAALAAELAARTADSLRPVLAFADCAQLEAWRRGEIARIDHLGHIGALISGGEPMIVKTPSRFLADLRKAAPAASAQEIAARPGSRASLIETGKFLVIAGASDSAAGRQLQVDAFTTFGTVVLGINLFQAGTGRAAEDGRRLAENAAALSSLTSEILVVNDVFDEVEKVETDSQATVLNVMTAVAGGLGLFSLLALRSLWLLLRAPRRRV